MTAACRLRTRKVQADGDGSDPSRDSRGCRYFPPLFVFADLRSSKADNLLQRGSSTFV